MGEAERYQEYKHLSKKQYTLGHPKNAIMALLVLNTVFFLTLFTIQVFYNYDNQSNAIFQESVMKWFTLPADFSAFLHRPWSIITYMFADSSASIWRLVSNMLWLTAWGYLLQEITDNNKLIPVYIYGGLISGLVFLTTSLLFDETSQLYLLGANGAVMAVAAAVTALSPNHRFYRHIGRGIPVWVLLIFYLIINLMGIGMHPSLMMAQAGGALTGVMFSWLLKKNIDTAAWMNSLYAKAIGLFSPAPKEQDNIKSRIFYETGNREPFVKSTRVTQEKIDQLLDKINSKGYESLTEEEKIFLKKASEEEN